MSAPPHEPLMTYEEASAYLNVPRGTLQSWVFEGKIPHYRFGPRTVRFCRTRLREWMASVLVDPFTSTAT